MNKKSMLLISLLFASYANAHTVNLACEGQIKSSTDILSKKTGKFTKNPSLDQNAWMRVNLTIDVSEKSIIVGDSYWTNLTKYTNLQISGSHYVLHYQWPDNQYKSMLLFIDRFDGSYKFSQSEVNNEYSLKASSTGKCTLGVHWQQKF